MEQAIKEANPPIIEGWNKEISLATVNFYFDSWCLEVHLAKLF